MRQRQESLPESQPGSPIALVVLGLGPSLAQTGFELSVMGQTGILAASKIDLYKTEFAYSAFLDRLASPGPVAIQQERTRVCELSGSAAGPHAHGERTC